MSGHKTFSLLGKKPTAEAQMKANKRQLNQAGRDIQRNRRDLERQEKQLELEIKKLAKTPAKNKEALGVLAKQLVQVRKQKARTYTADSRIKGVQAQQTSMQSNMKLANAMGATTATMKNMNQLVNPQDLSKKLKDFEQASAKFEMTEELMDSALDDILTESGDEEEADDIVNQVLDEIGIEIGAKVAGLPATHASSLGERSANKKTEDKELEEALACLRTNN
ncbi:charged multivesicular body protein 2b-A [Penaeus vannamei]|uniref:Putative vacuolar assembly/sorting protein DID4 n=1 Tax=Penaeus vannamei TaxID=6689 RepID=A0A423TQM3_PENVA|nr:charged multivesicular body protein 2b-A-like [Penaeus vannamei]XP_027207868.1 charged multivesicular body protein 2b-A-like [Penaeus vannamei]ROT78746.1 putative vacuolar assembly/sorting protein DID4 [Penaeus vannamei]